MSRSARSTIRAIASGASGSRTTTLQRESKRAVELERRVLGGRADEDDVARLDVRKEDVLLRAVEAVDLVEEEDRPLAVARAERARLLEDLAHLLHAGRDGRVRQEDARTSATRSAARASSCRRPGGPQRMSEGTRSSAIARRRKPLAPTTASGPSTSSSERGRMRSASGVAGANDPIGRDERLGRLVLEESAAHPARLERAGGTSPSRPATVSPPAAAGQGEARGRSRCRRPDRAPSRLPRAVRARRARGIVGPQERREEDAQTAQHRQEHEEHEEEEDDAGHA